MRKIPKSASLSDQAYEILKESILLGELKGGDPLHEEKYSKKLGISRTPFRDTVKFCMPSKERTLPNPGIK